jgi:hypothetical protein
LQQTFSVRFNRRTGRTGHVWENRDWSRVLEGELPEGVGEVDWAPVNNREPLFRRWQAIAIFCRLFGRRKSASPSSFAGSGLRRSGCRSTSAKGRVATPGDHAVGEADVCSAVQSVYGEDRACPGRPVLVAGAGRGAPGRGRRGGLGGGGRGGCDGRDLFRDLAAGWGLPRRRKTRRNPDFRPKPPPDPQLRPAKLPSPAPIRAESPTQPPRATPPNNGHGQGLPIAAIGP